MNIFRFSKKNISQTLSIFTICGLGYVLVSWGSNTLERLPIFLFFYVVFIALGFIALSQGSYVLVDQHNNLLRSSYFFFRKTIPLSQIDSLRSKGILGGALTELKIVYRTKQGVKKSRNLIAKEYFEQGEFEQFILTLKNVHPQIEFKGVAFDNLNSK